MLLQHTNLLRASKILKFHHNSLLYKSTALSNGYLEWPRKFTQLLKLPLAKVRKNNVSVIGYFDGITVALSEKLYGRKVSTIITKLHSLGFIIHPEESPLIPTKKLECLVYIFISTTKTPCLTDTKKQGIIEICKKTW